MEMKRIVILSCAAIFLCSGCGTGRVGKIVGPELGAPLPIEPEKPSETVASMHEDHTMVMVRSYNWVEPNESLDLASDSTDLDINGAVALVERTQGRTADLLSGYGDSVNVIAGVMEEAVERDRSGGFFFATGDGDDVSEAFAHYMGGQVSQQKRSYEYFSSVNFTGSYEAVATDYVNSLDSGLEKLDEIKALLERDEDGKADAHVESGNIVVDAPPSAPSSVEGTQRFLWKPVSDTTGKIVVLLPAKYNEVANGGGKLKVNDKYFRYSSIANGNRSHWRGGAPGSSYGSNISIVLEAKDGSQVDTWLVPDGSKRSDGR